MSPHPQHGLLRGPEVPPAGAEHVASSPGNSGVSEIGGATVGAVHGKLEADLHAVIEAWPNLPEEAKERIRELVERDRVER